MEINYRIKRLSIQEKVDIVTDYNAKIPILDILKKHKISKPTLYRILKTVVKLEGAINGTS